MTTASNPPSKIGKLAVTTTDGEASFSVCQVCNCTNYAHSTSLLRLCFIYRLSEVLCFDSLSVRVR